MHGFAFVGNLYQKMHFAGSNPATDRKSPKCIYKISKNFRVEKKAEKSLEISAFLVFSCLHRNQTRIMSHDYDLDAKPCVADLDARRF